MKKPSLGMVALALAGLYLVGTALLWPVRGEFLGMAPQSAQAPTPGVELAQLSPAAPLTLLIEPADGTAPLVSAIAGAHTSVDLAIYELEDTQVEQALASAAGRGIAVRVILENLNSFGAHPNQAAFDFLTSKHVPVEWAPIYFPLLHQKTLVVDGVEAFIMTFNLTPKYYPTSRDFAIIDSDPADLSAIAATFNSDWSGSRRAAQDGSDLVWSPGSADTLLALINTASSTLEIYNEEMADPRIVAALEAAAARGVAVQVDMTYETNWKANLQALVARGVAVRTYASSAKFYIHAKVIIADRTKAFVGSENFSTQSLDQNRELGVLVVRPNVIASLEATFNADWAGSRVFNADGTSAKSKK